MCGKNGPRATATVFYTPVTVHNISGGLVPCQPPRPAVDYQPGVQQIGSGSIARTGVSTVPPGQTQRKEVMEEIIMLGQSLNQKGRKPKHLFCVILF